jgi:hypothetical protein
MRFELFVAVRYLKAKRRQAVISVITVISVLGVHPELWSGVNESRQPKRGGRSSLARGRLPSLGFTNDARRIFQLGPKLACSQHAFTNLFIERGMREERTAGTLA